MICENCAKENSGSYGSGRFCCSGCSRAYSTKSKRKEINQKVSNKLTGRESPNKGKKQSAESIKKRMKSFTEEKRKAASEKMKQLRYDRYINLSFEELYSVGQKKRRVKEEQNHSCNRCGLSEWLGESIKLEVEHKDGNTGNNSRENLEALCPNCHSLTPTWRKSKNAKKIICEKLAPMVEWQTR